MYGTNDSTELQGDVLATGDFGSRFPLTYQFSSSGYRDNGYLKHSRTKNLNSEIVLGYKPTYDQDFYADIAYDKDRNDVTPAASYTAGDLDGNQDFDDRTYWIELGYHKRFSPISHLLTDFRYFRNHDKLKNPDPENDLTGFDQMRDELENMSFGLRHMFTFREDHQLSYGTDYNRVDFESRENWPYMPPVGSERDHQASKEKSLLFYAYDRWAALPHVTLDGGLFLAYFRAKDRYHYNNTFYGPGESLTNRSTWNLNPRLGVSADIGKRGVLRVAYQRRSTPGFLGELAPVGCAGLIPPTFDIQFSKAEDIQGSVEYELTKTTFVKAMFGYETLNDMETHDEAQLWYSRLAFNQILGRRFSFSVRYNYNDSKVLDGSGREIYGVPKSSGDARLVFVHPSQITLSLRESYVGSQYADDDNTVKLKSYFLTDLSAEKEFLQEKDLSFPDAQESFRQEPSDPGPSLLVVWAGAACPRKDLHPSGGIQVFALKRIVGISSLTFILALVLYLSFPGRHVDMKTYDAYSCVRGPTSPPTDIVIVGIDQESFSMMKRPWPWPRSIHGKLIRALGRAGAKGIVMDIIFSNPSNPREDRALAEAIREVRNVVLAADIEIVRTERFSQSMLITPIEELVDAGARFGVSSIPLDSDNVVRRIFWGTPEGPSLEVSAAEMLGISTEKDVARMVHFAGSAQGFPYAPYYQALDPERHLPEGFFKDKVVLVGKHSQAKKESFSDVTGKYRLHLQPPSPVRGVDMFATPSYIMDNRLSPGIEIHASTLQSLIRDDRLRPLRTPGAVILLALLSIFLTLVNRNWSPLKSVGANLVVGIGYLFVSYLLFSRQGALPAVCSAAQCRGCQFCLLGNHELCGCREKETLLERGLLPLSLSPGGQKNPSGSRAAETGRAEGSGHGPLFGPRWVYGNVRAARAGRGRIDHDTLHDGNDENHFQIQWNPG